MDYKEAGVDVELGDKFVKNILPFVKQTYNENVTAGVGGFAALYKIGAHQYLASATDGVGTKLMLAMDVEDHSTIGQDLVAMCVNDIICTGATPLFFLDYLATGKLTPKIHEEVIKGIAKACELCETALIGGETAEMPGMYHGKEYDLAGFVVGLVNEDDIISGESIEEGDYLIGLHSSGFHSNGLSLVRKLIRDSEDDLKRACLTPTTLYAPLINELARTFHVGGLANITGGGMLNIARMNKKFDYDITTPRPLSDLPEFMQVIIDRSQASEAELYRTFNMGTGLVICTSKAEDVCEWLSNQNMNYQILGQVKKGSGKVLLRGEEL